jgi:hypothetical protein
MKNEKLELMDKEIGELQEIIKELSENNRQKAQVISSMTIDNRSLKKTQRD